MKKNKHELTKRQQSELSESEFIQPEQIVRFFHAVNPGDLIASMGSIKSYYDRYCVSSKRKINICQSINQIAAYYQGATHPTVNETGQNVCCNIPMWEMLKPLVESQYYVNKFEQYNGQKIDVDLNIIRGKTPVNLPYGAIQTWVSLAYPDLQFDLTKKWICVDDNCPKDILKLVKGKVIINFTERYRNTMIDYNFLKHYAPDLIFAGTEKEHWLFCNQWGLGSVPRLVVKDFLELAYAIKNCRFLLGNQSMNWNLAEAMKTPRLLEICTFAPNCVHMVGDNSYGFLYQVGCEFWFRALYDNQRTG